MNSTAALLSPILKEARALTVPWLACVLCMILPSVLDDPRMLGGLSVPAYFLGAAALGALSVGHEYTGRTLSLLLSLPARRQRLLAVKLGVMATLLLTLWAVAYTLVFSDTRLPQASRQAASVLPVLCGLFLAPWLTMMCRSAVGGAVFTLALPGTLLVIGELLGVKMYGDGPVMNAFRLAFVWYGTLGLCAIGAALTWWKFTRLETTDGHDQAVSLPHWLRGSRFGSSAAAHVTRRNPVWLLVQKELHLQLLPLALATLFVLGWVVVISATTLAEDPVYGSALAALTFLYAGLLPMIIGASACAGERQIGMLELQVVQPMSVAKQWSIKLTVVFGLSLLLALALPMMLLYVSNLGMIRHPMMLVGPEQTLVIALLLLTGGSLYISSLCGSALWALVMSIPSAMAAATFFQVAWGRVAAPTYRIARTWAMHVLQPETIGPINDMRMMNWVALLLILGFIALGLRLAFTNHRSADRASARIWRQLTFLAVFAIGAIILHSTALGITVANNMLQLPPQFRSR